MDMMCCKCKKRPAMLYVAKFDGKEMTNEGYCLKCAAELGLPQVKSMMDSMGITKEDLDRFDEQLESFENGTFNPDDMEGLPAFFQQMLGRAGAPEDALEEEGELVPDEPVSDSGRIEAAPNRKERNKKKSFLENFCVNLTEKAKNGGMDRVIGRDQEIYRVEQILSRRQKNNPCLIGEPGVGKTAVAEGIAQRIVSGDVPFRLANKELYLLDLTSLVAGTQFRGQFESRVKGLIDEIKKRGNVILFIDEIHSLVGAGDADGSMNAANIMKPALSRGEIQVIGATTFGEYRKYIEKDSALERRFQPVKVEEPTIAQTIDILKGVKGYYEEHHKVRIPDEILELCAHLSERYITDRFLPDKAIDLLDESAACASINSTLLTDHEKLNRELKTLTDRQQELEQATDAIDYEALAKTKADILATREKLKEMEPKLQELQVTPEDVAKVVELWTGIPAEKVSESDFARLSRLEEHLKARIIGQDEAIHAVSAAIRRSKVHLSKKRRPASFIFVGPTGVGKTELVKVLAEELFDDKTDPLIRVDMSEFMEKHAVSRLVGSPPGYVGFDEAGQLTEKVRRRPYSVVLFDEIEKAHPDVMNILLQILDEGRITDAQGRTVSFENTVVVMTSNAGSNDRTGIVGFNQTAASASKEKAMKGLSSFLRPEFLARVDEIVVFNPLTEENLAKIARLMLSEMEEPLSEIALKLSYSDEVPVWLAKKASGGKFAARDLRSTVRREVEDKIAALLTTRSAAGKEVYVQIENDQTMVSLA